MKFYQAEMMAFDFMKGDHTLQEWADFGYNKVAYNGNDYWDGALQGYQPIPAELANKMLVYKEYDYDDDGFMYIILEDVKDE